MANFYKRRMLMSACVLVGGLATEAPAQFKTWIGGAGVGTWSNPASWSPAGVPTATDIAFLSQSDASNRIVSYQSNPGTLNSAALIQLNATGTGQMTLSQSVGRLNVPTLTLANSGHGVFNLFNIGVPPTANIGALNVANFSAAVGTVLLNGGALNITNTFNLGNGGTGHCLVEVGSVSAGALIVGNLGHGFFTQSPNSAILPTVTANVIRIGVGSQSSGVYEMGGFLGPGGFVNAGTIEVGVNGSGVFSHDLGSFVTCTNDLILGGGTLGAGTYAQNGTLNIGGDLIVGGRGGDGTFNQSGRVEVDAAVRIGNGGRFNSNFGRLNAGSVLLLPGGAFNGSSGMTDADSFVQSGGSVTGTLIVDRISTLQPPANYIYNSGAFSGKLDLRHRSMLTLNADFTANDGLSLRLGTFSLPAGRTLTLNGSGLTINAATVSLNSHVNATTLFMHFASTLDPPAFLEQLGTSQVTIGDGLIGSGFGPGTYRLSGAGASVQFAQLFLGNATLATSTGHVIVAAGSLSTTGITRIDRGDFVQTAGAATFAAVLNNGTMQLSGGVTSANEIDGTGAVIVSGGGSLTANRIRQSQLMITGANPRVRIRGNGTDSATSRIAALDLGTPAFAAITGMLDLTDNGLVVDYTAASPQSQITQYLASGYNGGSWNGAGISSSLADASQFAVGYAESADLFTSFPAIFRGQSVDNTSVLIAFARYGDANLDGTTNINDFARLAANFNLPGDWNDGNFNFDAAVNIADFAKLAANFNQSLATDVPRGGATVPEPLFGAFIGIISGILLTRRRR